MLIFSLAVSISTAESGKNIGTLPGMAEKLALDGKKDAAYKNALHINEMVSHDGKATPLAKTDFYLLYDRDAIWVFCEVEDATLTTKAADPKQPNYKVDSIEIMLDMTNKAKISRIRLRCNAVLTIIIRSQGGWDRREHCSSCASLRAARSDSLTRPR